MLWIMIYLDNKDKYYIMIYWRWNEIQDKKE